MHLSVIVVSGNWIKTQIEPDHNKIIIAYTIHPFLAHSKMCQNMFYCNAMMLSNRPIS